MQFAKAASILGFQNFFQPEATSELQEQFASHMESYGLSYGTREEHDFRLELYKKKDIEINYWNKNQDSFELEHNMFSTMTEAEHKMWLGAEPPKDFTMEETVFDESENGMTRDWRNQMNSVKNQGGCGSCWAFSATAGTEHAHYRAARQRLNLSEQQLVDCDRRSHGCNGGWYFYAWEHLR